jgi:hypothetical protein
MECIMANKESATQEFLLLFRGGDGNSMRKDPEKWKAQMELWGKWMGEMGKQGKFVSAQPLDPASGKQIHGGKMTVTDGPFMEGKEIVGGYLICKAADYEEAVALARGCPILQFDSGNVEVRAIQEM